jgi:hypothetical protein
MDYGTFAAHLNALVSEYLDRGGDPAHAADLMREIADEVFEEPDEGPPPESIHQMALW